MGEENGSLQSLDWNEWIGMVDWNGGIADLQFLGFKGAQNLILCTRLWKVPRQPQQTLDSQRRAPDSSKLVPDSPRWPSDGTSYLHMAPDGPQMATAVTGLDWLTELVD